MNIIYTIVRRDNLLKSQTFSLLNELFENCLFSIPTIGTDMEHQPSKFKTLKSRVSAFKLITELAREYGY